MGLFDGAARVLGIGGGGGYSAPPINEAAFKNPYLDADKKKVDDFLTAFKSKNQPYTAPQAAQISSGQVGLVNTLQNTVAGNGPSVAENQLRQGQEGNLNALVSAASGVHGSNYGQQVRAVARGAAQIGRDTNAQAATLRATEQNQAANTLGGVLANMQQTQQTATLSGEQLTQNYLNMGLSLDQAQFLANQDLERTKAGIATAEADRLQRSDAAIIGAVAAGGAAAIGKK